MALRKYFRSTTSSRTESSSDAAESKLTEDSCEDDHAPGPSKRVCTQSNRKYNKKWEKSFHWLQYDEDIDGALCNVCKKWAHPASSMRSSGGVWNYIRFVAQQPKESIGEQLQELVTNNMMGAMYPNLKLLATVCLTMPVTTASVERSFSKMKLIKSRL